MLAVVNVNGKQYEVEEGRYLFVDRMSQAPEEKVTLEQVLLVADGKDTLVGAPYVEGATVKAKVLSHERDKKVLVYKMRPKKGYRRKNGHRQDLTRLEIEVIDFPGKKASAKPAKKEEEKVEKKPAKKAEAPAEKKETAKKPAAKKATKTTEAKADKPAAKKPAAKKADAKADKPAAKKPAAKKKDDAAE